MQTQDLMSTPFVDLAFLIARVLIGLLIAAHGAQKLFGWFGGHGLRRTIPKGRRSTSSQWPYGGWLRPTESARGAERWSYDASGVALLLYLAYLARRRTDSWYTLGFRTDNLVARLFPLSLTTL
jgi:hypothetical protein